MTSPQKITLRTESLSVETVSHGAELVSLAHTPTVDSPAQELLWQAGPAWRRHAPVLFPIVCRVPDDTIHHDGVDYPLSQHGFARDREFALVGSTESTVLWALESDEQTLARFPFAFRLTIEYSLVGSTLTITESVTNTGDEPLGASVGNHPAFRRPLPGGVRAEHVVEFADEEPEGFHRAPENLLLPEAHPAPLVDGVLTVDDALFEDGVLIFTEARRRVLRYSAPGAPTIVLDSGDFTTMGVWAPVGADFLCLEPWAGYPAPLGWDGDILDKPGQFRAEPGETVSFSYSISVEPA